MITPKQLDDIARRIQSALPAGLGQLHDDLRQNTREAIMGVLTRMDLVSREEFDTQAAVLARTREKLEALEAKVAELEKDCPPP
ncbi:MAG: accessory factor UbiK family protein [Gammaproteobacteria bacterium]|nr:accessory factor UbiK family protein [Gammaproteobacteria bacterium]